MNPVETRRGDGPVILGFPHGGTIVPAKIAQHLNDTGRLLEDTDWHIAQLYEGLLPSATTVAATFHRYVIDANRDPAGVSLYPGQNTTGLCPTTDFDGKPIWQSEPKDDDIAARLKKFHVPYHAALAAEVARVKAMHGVAIVYDCHSIRSQIPFLFEGTLPTLNIGTDMGKTCDAKIEQRTFAIAKASGFTHILNGRFRGGWTTRHYGQPATGVHAIQMEITQNAYLETEAQPFTYSEAKSAELRPHLKAILETLEQTAKEIAHG